MKILVGILTLREMSITYGLYYKYKKRFVVQNKSSLLTEDHFEQHMNITTIYN